METVDGVYEYDAEKRAEEDFLKQPDKYNSDASKRKHVLELCRFAQSKAVTGAQWIVIKKLAKIAASFKTPQELQRGMKLIRYDRNVNGILADPQMRAAAIDRMLGMAENIYGPERKQLGVELAVAEGQPVERTVDVQSGEVIEPPKADEGQRTIEFEDDIPWDETPTDMLKRKLRDYLPKFPPTNRTPGEQSAIDVIEAMVANKEATEEQLKDLAKRVEDFLAKKATAKAARKAGAA
jgi:hypothetical protein